MIRSKKYREAARGQPCTANIAGVCTYQQETVVLCHFPGEDHGIGIKASDINAGDCCAACHDVIDGRVQCEEYRQHAHFYLRRAQTRTIRNRIERGILKL